MNLLFKNVPVIRLEDRIVALFYCECNAMALFADNHTSPVGLHPWKFRCSWDIQLGDVDFQSVIPEDHRHKPDIVSCTLSLRSGKGSIIQGIYLFYVNVLDQLGAGVLDVGLAINGSFTYAPLIFLHI